MTPAQAASLFNKWTEIIEEVNASRIELAQLPCTASEGTRLDTQDAFYYARQALEVFQNDNRTQLDLAGDILSELTQTERAALGLK